MSSEPEVEHGRPTYSLCGYVWVVVAASQTAAWYGQGRDENVVHGVPER
jgi:hypothetical protein